MTEVRQISDADLIRMLGEYTGKAQRAAQEYRQFSGLIYGILIGFASLAAIGFAIARPRGYEVSDGNPIDPIATVYVLLVIIFFAASLLWSTRFLSPRGSNVQLAVWQLRRVYELASRREDLGIELDSGLRLELELRLSEAAFTLTDLEKFHKPEKFREFTRIGKDSPFREIEPDLQWPPPAQSIPSPKSSS